MRDQVWVLVRKDEYEALLKRIRERSPILRHLLQRLKEQFEEDLEKVAGLIDDARENYAVGSNDDIEIDDSAPISEADNGTWVGAWVWLRKEEDEEEGEEEPEEVDAK